MLKIGRLGVPAYRTPQNTGFPFVPHLDLYDVAFSGRCASGQDPKNRPPGVRTPNSKSLTEALLQAETFKTVQTKQIPTIGTQYYRSSRNNRIQQIITVSTDDHSLTKFIVRILDFRSDVTPRAGKFPLLLHRHFSGNGVTNNYLINNT